MDILNWNADLEFKVKVEEKEEVEYLDLKIIKEGDKMETKQNKKEYTSDEADAYNLKSKQFNKSCDTREYDQKNDRSYE